MSENSTLLHDLSDVTIRRAVVSEMANNVYLITAKATGAQVLIDAAADPEAIKSLFADAEADSEKAIRPALIATTHQHWDHVRALADMVAHTGAQTAAGVEDVASIKEQTGVGTDVLLGHGDVGNFEGFDLTSVHLRGHTPGSIALVLRDSDGTTVIFSGDSLFPGGVGNTQQDPARFTSLLNDVESRIFGVYPDDAIVLPGHGKTTTLGAERPHLAEWRLRGW
ncbi:MBL fold metallo-hydrolase [Paeniglutamicibacter cryotolerans]|uniref:Glyoxylase-like metal-dependent hydrolase (Beta-lactamase superfamily II) n=1 Tax=Paeniglutamicibacter cryotolerans TaxID=670079 RepID=A0A839QMQ0_9MICC|nr:MBL fold metallo-hydrolase [Paeniglutamicibacter cryotolerans]MBB2996863.1 glyoxylase-like metal-dependent hydrolase (beta-lactamase superfamily II) [Paeniglutamicibacter cryotolerans]